MAIMCGLHVKYIEEAEIVTNVGPVKLNIQWVKFTCGCVAYKFAGRFMNGTYVSINNNYQWNETNPVDQ